MPEGRPASAEPVVVAGLVKSFGAARVLRGVDLMVPAGSLVALLGPSGCGKTTLLRAVAGLERPDGGEVRVAGRMLSGPGAFVPAERRRIGMVFQEAALFPHLTVARNVAYGLPRRDPGRGDRVREALELVGLAGFGERAVQTLSGGQAQRVAIARALAPRPSVMLLDEPFSSLDAPLRTELRMEVRRMLRAIDATAIFVTHDQEEAFVVGDEVAVMSDGLVVQQGSPTALYELPATRGIAEFIGDANFIPGSADGEWARTTIGPIPLVERGGGPGRGDGAPGADPRGPRRRRHGDGSRVLRTRRGVPRADRRGPHGALARDRGAALRAGRPRRPGVHGRCDRRLSGGRDSGLRTSLSAGGPGLVVLGGGPAGVGAAHRASPRTAPTTERSMVAAMYAALTPRAITPPISSDRRGTSDFPS